MLMLSVPCWYFVSDIMAEALDGISQQVGLWVGRVGMTMEKHTAPCPKRACHLLSIVFEMNAHSFPPLFGLSNFRVAECTAMISSGEEFWGTCHNLSSIWGRM